MQIPLLTVELQRSPVTRNLTAHVIQRQADGDVYGENILKRRHIRRIETAKEQARAQLVGVKAVCCEGVAGLATTRKGGC